uniref:Uncharacterized protein n=1 Tax=viral metagenome TaxID=1070528 RepID=A0A2V0R9A9_9ZZZZ
MTTALIGRKAYLETDADFIKRFNGVDDIYGGNVKYDKAFEHLTSDPSLPAVQKKAVACLILYLKPKLYFFNGTSKTKGNGVGVEREITKYLPQHDEIPVGDDTVENEKIIAARNKLPEYARKVNFVGVRIIALMTLQACSEGENVSGFICISKAHAKWIAHNHSINDALKHFDSLYAKENDETKSIKFGHFKSFMAEKNYWEDYTPRIVAIFSRIHE